MVTKVYDLTRNFPDSEKFGLISQIRRAAVSVASNIAEGSGRKSDKQFAQFISIAIGSCFELETQFIISKNLNYITNDDEILQELNEIQKMMHAFMKNLKI